MRNGKRRVIIFLPQIFQSPKHNLNLIYHKYHIGDTNSCPTLLSYRISITVQALPFSWPTTCRERCQHHPASYTTSLQVKSVILHPSTTLSLSYTVAGKCHVQRSKKLQLLWNTVELTSWFTSRYNILLETKVLKDQGLNYKWFYNNLFCYQWTRNDTPNKMQLLWAK